MTELLTRTVCVKLDVTGHKQALQETQRRFNEAATWIAAVCWEERITNSNTAHYRVYGQTRARFGLGAQLAVCARAKAMEAVKATCTGEKNRMARWKAANTRRRKVKKKLLPPPEPVSCPQFRPRGSIRYDARSSRLLSLDRVSLNTLTGRIICHLLPGQRQHELLVDPDWKIGGAELVWRDGTYYLHLTQTRESPSLSEAEDVLGIDLGISNVATDSTGEQFTGSAIHKKRSRLTTRRAALQRRGTRSARRRLQKMRRREHRWMRDVNHCIAKTLVAKAAVSRKALALEYLTGIREGEVTVRRENRYERHCWAFYQLRLFLTYKAAWAGIEVRLVDPAYTSQTCSRSEYCSLANRHSQASFHCQRCGFRCHADYNAAINIARVGSQAAHGSAGTSAATSPSCLRDVGT